MWSSSSSFNLAQTISVLPDNFPTLSFVDKSALTKPVSKGEVFHTLRSMPRVKSLGRTISTLNFIFTIGVLLVIIS